MNYEQYLDRYGVLTYRFKGISMLPMLRQGKDTFTVVKKTQARCKKYDVALYRRGEQYVLHRVVKVLPQSYVILGDNCAKKEYNITDEDIIGVLQSFTRGERSISVDHRGYRLYARVWYWLYPLRHAWMRLRSVL